MISVVRDSSIAVGSIEKTPLSSSVDDTYSSTISFEGCNSGFLGYASSSSESNPLLKSGGVPVNHSVGGALSLRWKNPVDGSEPTRTEVLSLSSLNTGAGIGALSS